MIELSQKDIELIEAFLEDRLLEGENDAFLDRLKKDAEFAANVSDLKVMKETIVDQSAIEFRRKLQSISQDNKSSFFRTNYLKIAASIIIILVCGWGVAQLIRQDLTYYDQYYTVYLSEPLTRGSNNIDLTEIVSQYDKGNFSEIINDLQEIINEDGITGHEKDQFRMYLGNCYLNFNETNKAIHQFSAIASESPKYEFAQWYLALSYLKIEKNEKAKSALKTVIAIDGLYLDKAKDLLNALSL